MKRLEIFVCVSYFDAGISTGGLAIDFVIIKLRIGSYVQFNIYGYNSYSSS